MSATVLFEQRYRGEIWRLVVSEHKGHEFARLCVWYWKGEVLTPGKGGVVIQLDRLPELHAALGDYLKVDRQAAA